MSSELDGSTSLVRPAGVVVVTFDAYATSTRARKAARAYSEVADTTFLGMSAAGRTGRWGQAGTSTEDDIRVHLVPMRKPSLRPSTVNVAKNLLLTYLPALLRMTLFLLRTQAEVVHVVGAPLAPLGLVHKVRHRSRLVLDVQERPGAVAAKGSASTVFARVERLVLALARRQVDVATVVTPPDVDALEKLGFRTVTLVRNVPLSTWRAEFRPVPPSPPVFVAIGSIFEGRGYEMLLKAAAQASQTVSLRVRIFGTGREDYLQALQEQSQRLALESVVEWCGRVTSAEVSNAYLDSHVGLVLYESADPGNDGLSNKILECVASGRPVLAGDLPQNRAFVTSNDVGWLTPMTVDGLAQSMVDVALRTDLPEMATHCRTVGDNELVWESEFAPVIRASFGAVASTQSQDGQGGSEPS